MQQIRLTTEHGFESQLSYDGRRMKRFSTLTPSVISITEHLKPERARVERYIESVFAAHYQAQVAQHYPTLMSIRTAENEILGALGFRFAASERLFLEHYLDATVEQEVSARVGHAIPRAQIVEVGSLASQGRGASIFLITALLAYLRQQGYPHVVLTATHGLHHYFDTLGLNPQVIAEADQSRLADGGASWGSYYDTAPRVVVGDVIHASERMQRVLGVALQSEDQALFTRLHPLPVVG